MNVVVNSVNIIYRPGTDTFCHPLIYNTADLDAALIISDRVPYANRIVEILNKSKWTIDAL